MTPTKSDDEAKSGDRPAEGGGPGREARGAGSSGRNPRLVVAWTVAAVLVLSVGARFLIGSSQGAASSDADSSRGSSSAIAPTGFLPDGSPAPDGEGTAEAEGEAAVPEGVASALPVVTEASFFGLIGFALGYASRKAVKLGLLAIAGLFITLQTLVYLDVVAVDWSRAVSLVNDLVLNLQQDQTLAEIAKAKIPTAGALAGGYFVGFRRG